MRLVRPLALLLALLSVAGCLSFDSTGDDGTSLPSEGALRFLAPVPMPVDADPDRGALEPSVAVDPSGNVYLTAAKGVNVNDPAKASWLWVSNDAGKTFRAISPVEGTQAQYPSAGAEGHVDANAEGKAYFVDLTQLAGVSVSRSADGGKTWELRGATAAYVPGGDREWVAAGPGDAVYVVWNQIPSGFWVFGSADGGRTFTAQTRFPGTSLAGDAEGGPGWSYAGVPAVASDGTVYVARAEGEGVAVYASKDGARTFSRTVAWPAEGDVGWLFSTVTVDHAGTVYVSTVETMDDTTRVRYAYSKDAGATFSAPREVTAAPGTHAMQWGAAGPAGHFAVAFYENPDAKGTPDDANGKWYVRVSASRNADTDQATFREARVTPSPVHEGAVCTGGLGNCEGNSRALGDYLGVDVGWDGSVHVTWADSTDGERTRTMYARTAS